MKGKATHTKRSMFGGETKNITVQKNYVTRRYEEPGIKPARSMLRALFSWLGKK